MFDANETIMFIRIPDLTLARKIADQMAMPRKPATPPARMPAPRIPNADMAAAHDM